MNRFMNTVLDLLSWFPFWFLLACFAALWWLFSEVSEHGERCRQAGGVDMDGRCLRKELFIEVPDERP